LDKAILSKFEEWVKWKPKAELSYLRPAAFAHEKGVAVDEAKEFFRELVCAELITARPSVRCDHCEAITTIDANDGDTFCCGGCENEIVVNFRNLEGIVYTAKKEDFAHNAPFSETDVLMKHKSRKPTDGCNQAYVDAAETTKDDEVKYVKIAIIAAMEKELKPLLALLGGRCAKTYKMHTYHEGFLAAGDKKVSVVAAHCADMGMVAATNLTSDMIHRFKPDYVAMIGIAASLDGGNHGFGDILVPEYIWDYGVGKIKGINDGGASFLQHEPKQRTIDSELKNKIETFKKDANALETSRMVSLQPLPAQS